MNCPNCNSKEIIKYFKKYEKYIYPYYYFWLYCRCNDCLNIFKKEIKEKINEKR